MHHDSIMLICRTAFIIAWAFIKQKEGHYIRSVQKLEFEIAKCNKKLKINE